MRRITLRGVLFVLGWALVNASLWNVYFGSSTGRQITPAASPAGFSSRNYVDSDDSSHPYTSFVPYQRTNDVRLPVILYLNGFGENGDDGLMQIFENFGQPVWEMKRRFPFAVVAAQCPIDETWEPDRPPIQRALRILDLFMHEVDADPDRVFLMGVSSGGGSVWSVAQRFPERFAGIIPLSSGRPLEGTVESAKAIVATGIPVWAGFNRHDRSEFADFNRTMKLELLNAGGSPHYFEFGAVGHDCWNRAMRSPALYAWMLMQRRSLPTSGKYRLADLSQFEQDFETINGDAWALQTAGILKSPATDDTDAVVLSRREVTDFELHAECRSDLESDFGFTFDLLDKESDATSRWSVLFCGPSAGGAALSIEDPSEWIADIDVLAQRALVPDDWNDIRLRIEGSHLEVEVNGWNALDIKDERLASRTKRFGLIQGKGSTKSSEWRLIRTRDPEKIPSDVADGE